MGKGNRARIERAQNKLDMPQVNQADKKQKSGWGTKAAVIFIVAILAVSILLGALNSTGATMRGRTAIESENFSISGTMMSYFFYSQYTSFISQYGSLVSYLGLSTDQSLKTQDCQMMEDGTWFDYFMNAASSYATELLNSCEYAKANGIELGDEDYESIDEALEAMNEAAFENNYTLAGYIGAMYGAGVKEKDLRAAMEIVLLANKAAVDASDKFEAALTEDEIVKYYDEHPESFLFADYTVKAFTAEKAEVDKDDYDDTADYEAAVKAADEAYAAAKAEALAAAKAYEGLADYAAFLEKLQADLTAEYDGYYDDDDALTEEEREAKEKTQIAADLEKATVEDYAYQDPTAEEATDLAKWLFAEGRKVGDITVLEDEDEEAGTYSANAYCVKASAARDEYKAADISYVLYSAAETASTAAADALKAKLAGVTTKEAFEAAIADETVVASGTMENLLKDQFGFDEADEYIFAENRKAGDCEVVKCGTDYIAVILYTAQGDDAWYAGAKSGSVSEKMTAWYETNAETYTVEINEKVLEKVSA